MNPQDQLIAILKKKGTGPTMSKTLSEEELIELTQLMANPDANITTKATLLTAFLMLENTPEEATWLSQFSKDYKSNLPTELHWLIEKTSSTPFESLTQKVISHQDLSYEEMTWGMEQVLDSATPNLQKAAFLEAERLKRENMDENIAALDVCQNISTSIKTDIPILIDLAVAYDGLGRTPCVWVATAAVLAALGYPTVLHGVDEVSPKRGVTPHKLLKCAGQDPLITPDQAIARLHNPDIGWTYIDQYHSSPDLHDLKILRKEMVERPILATIEKLLQPIQGKKETITITSYTHPPYKEKMIQLLKHNRQDRFLLIRGVEGSIQLPTDRRAPAISRTNDTITDDFVRPEDYETDKYPDGPITSEESLTWCIEGLKGTHPYATPWISYLAHTILSQVKLDNSPDLKAKIKAVLESGKALNHFQNFT